MTGWPRFDDGFALSVGLSIPGVAALQPTVSGTPANAYVAEDGSTFYVAEDGSTFYVQES